MAIGAAYSHSGVIVTTEPADASDDGICTVKNCVIGRN
jgi:hypothetical protein